MAPVIWAPSALDDVDAIATYVARDSPQQAALLVTRLIQVADRLETFPLSGRVIPKIAGPARREILYGVYRVMKQVEGDRVLIIGVVHGARQWSPQSHDRPPVTTPDPGGRTVRPLRGGSGRGSPGRHHAGPSPRASARPGRIVGPPLGVGQPRIGRREIGPRREVMPPAPTSPPPPAQSRPPARPPDPAPPTAARPAHSRTIAVCA